ncbi:MAG TPA: NADP-dependent malic enzyme [Gammaproteobacteria bacterium]|nr:NADP-dependent malic enzyme [Gammaproteobacteria bacterium]
MSDDTDKSALDYHRYPRPGKIEVVATKPLANQRDLALAYSPGVAEPCKAIESDPAMAAEVTSRSNLVAVITNGTAVLGLGNIGPLAAKPVMEGKGVLFKKFAGIDVFDIEINEQDPEKLIEIIASLEPTFGGINLEDIKSPECFQVEGVLRNRLNIPIFHDDQHGTAIIVSAAVLNALRIVEKNIGDVRMVTTGAGASGIACLKLLVELGLKKENIIVLDRSGVIYRKRGGLTPHKKLFASDTKARTLADAIQGADIFLGLSGPGVVKQEMIRSMADKPIVMALSNPIPEILPEEVRAVRPDAIIATGRSDYPNQVNNVLCFPFIFRGALDVGATRINKEMQIACVQALAELAMEDAPDTVVAAYGGMELKFGPEYLIPKPFDPRLITKLAPAVAQAAMDSGVATRRIDDMAAYHDQLSRYVFESVMLMRPVFERAKLAPKRLVYAEGEEPKILRTVQSVIDEGIASPILVGNPDLINDSIQKLGLRLRPGSNVEIVDPERHADYGMLSKTGDQSQGMLNTMIAARMLKNGEADGLICGITGRYHEHLQNLVAELGVRDHVGQPAGMNILLLKKGVFFISDTAVTENPNSEQIAEITLLAAEGVRRFGIVPKAALLSFSNNDRERSASAKKMHAAMDIIRKRDPELEVAGHIRADSALLESIRDSVMPGHPMKGEANLLIMPNLDAAKIAYDLLKVLGDGTTIGPILLGLNQPVHVMTPSATVRRIMNASALAVVDAQRSDDAGGDAGDNPDPEAVRRAS